MAARLKKALSVLIAACLVVAVLPVTAFAAAMVDPSISSAANKIKVNETVEMTISLEGIPYTGRVIPNDVVLVVDRSGSMSGKDSAMKDAAKTFINDLDLKTHTIGVVSYASDVDSIALSTDKTALTDYIDNIASPNGTTAMDLGIKEAMKVLENKRSNTSGAIVLMTDGEPNSADSAKAAATEAKAQGYVFYTVALTTGEESNANKFLKELATSETDHYSVFSTSQLNSVYKSVASKIGACNAKDVIVEQTISSQFEYVAGSGDNSIPKPTVSGNKLTWEFPQLSKGISTVSFKLRAKDVAPGSYKPCFGNVTYTDYNNAAQVISLHASNVNIIGVPKVTGVTATPGDRQVTVAWNAVSGAEKYRICVFQDGTIKKYVNVDGSETSGVVTGLLNNVEYGFWVQAYINAGYDAEPDTKNLVYATPKGAPKVLPETPTGLTAVPGNRSVTLTWDPVDGATQYRICVYKGTTIQKYVTVKGATTQTVTSLTNGVKYGFWVQSYTDRYSENPDKTNLVYATPKAADTRPATPANIKAVPGNKSVTVTWDPVAGATKYRVCIFKNGSIMRYVNVDAGTTTATVSNLANGTKYGFWVQTYTNKYSADPDKANLIMATPKAVDDRPATPTGLTVVAGDKSAVVKWDAVAGAEKYRINIIKDGVVQKYVNVTGATSGTVTGLLNGTKYGFWVQSYTTKYSVDPDMNALVYATPKSTNTGKPATPTITGVVPGSKSVTVTWDSVPGATKYRICIILNGKVQRYVNVEATENSKVVTNLLANQEYGIWVQAYGTQYSDDPDVNTAPKFVALA
ncbi:MAG: fibronectin type III domain-containing protein [Oscillospiraceae bacterium]